MNKSSREVWENEGAMVCNCNSCRLGSVFLPSELRKMFERKTLLITGATGYIGRELIDYFMSYPSGHRPYLYILTRSRKKAYHIFGRSSYQQILEWGDQWKSQIEKPVDYIIHAASETSSYHFLHHPVETIHSVTDTSFSILSFLCCYPKAKLLFLSTMEVYGISGYPNSPLSEADYGSIDVLNTRSSYPQAKSLIETLCFSYVKEYGCHISIARLSQILDATVSDDDNRMFAQFVHKIQSGEDIVLHTVGNTVRSYCSLPDSISAILYILAYGEDGAAYNVANESMTYSVYELASLLAKYYGRFVIINEKEAVDRGYLPSLIMPLNSQKLRQLGWSPKIGIEEIIAAIHTQEELR